MNLSLNRGIWRTLRIPKTFMQKSIRIAVGAFVGLFLFFGLALTVDLDLGDLQGRLFDPVWALIAVFAYFPCALMRSFRMRHFAPETYKTQGLLNMASVVTAHQAANHIFPMKLGELTYPTLMRVMGGPSFARGVGATLLMRFSDLVGLGVVVLFGALSFSELSPMARGALSAGALAAVFVGIVGIARGELLLRVLRPLVRPVAPAAVDRLSDELAEALGAMDKAASTWVAVVMESSLLWFGLVGVHCALGCAFGLCLSPAPMAVGALGSILCGYLPVSTVLNLGTVEFGWVATLPLVGVAPKEALLIGTSIHFSLIGITFGYALLGLMIAGLRKKATEPEEQGSSDMHEEG